MIGDIYISGSKYLMEANEKIFTSPNFWIIDSDFDENTLDIIDRNERFKEDVLNTIDNRKFIGNIEYLGPEDVALQIKNAIKILSRNDKIEIIINGG